MNYNDWNDIEKERNRDQKQVKEDIQKDTLFELEKLYTKDQKNNEWK